MRRAWYGLKLNMPVVRAVELAWATNLFFRNLSLTTGMGGTSVVHMLTMACDGIANDVIRDDFMPARGLLALSPIYLLDAAETGRFTIAEDLRIKANRPARGVREATGRNSSPAGPSCEARTNPPMHDPSQASNARPSDRATASAWLKAGPHALACQPLWRSTATYGIRTAS